VIAVIGALLVSYVLSLLVTPTVFYLLKRDRSAPTTQAAAA
jgi:multidrug efflux pump subunit AcrB